MKPVVLPSQAREIDREMIEEAKIPSLLLMEQAAFAVCGVLEQMELSGRRILVVAGGGNNGGDAFAAGRILLLRGFDVQVGFLSSGKLPADAATNFAFWEHSGRLTLLDGQTALADFFGQPADAILDGLFGIGLNREPAGLYADIIRAINQHPAKKVAIDIPSGVFGETGAAPLAVWADETVTFQYAKPGHLLFPGRALTGRLHIAKIGVDHAQSPLQWVDDFSLPPRPANTHKGSYGRLAIVAGSRGMAGAALLCTRAGIAGGAGLTTLLSCPSVCEAAQISIPTATVLQDSLSPDFLSASRPAAELLAGFQAVAVGPGLGKHSETSRLVQEIAALPLPKVMDADALTLLSQALPKFGSNTILTPHPKEFSRLSGLPVERILEYPVACAQEFSQKHGVVLLLKGATTVVADQQRAYLITAGSPGMAKGGSGDALTGVIGALLAQGLSPATAAYGGAYLCGKAGERAAKHRGEYSMTAEDTIAHLWPCQEEMAESCRCR